MKSIRTYLDNPMVKARIKAFKRDPIQFVKVRVDGLIYDIRCFFRPYNVVKCSKLARSWTDRDNLMMHAMFQILVDFVELEQPFISWDDQTKYKKKRHTDRAQMHAFVEKHYNTEEGRSSNYAEWMSDEEKAKMDLSTLKHYRINKEILYLYEWYKDEKYEFDFSYFYGATGERLKIGDKGGIEHVKTGKPSLITWGEFYETEQEHDAVVAGMLERILVVRDYLWT